MKIICDCGNEMEFTEKGIQEDGSIWAKQNWEDIEVLAEHDKCWINCKKCNKSIYFFT